MSTVRSLLLGLGFSLPALGCECPPPKATMEKAPSVALVRLVELSLPPLNPGQLDSLARTDVLHGRAVVIETLRGPETKIVSLVGPKRAGMCVPHAALGFDLGETIMLFFDATQDALEFDACTPALRFGQDWQGWDGGTLRIRDHFQGQPKTVPADFDRWVDPYLWVPGLPPPPPPPPK